MMSPSTAFSSRNPITVGVVSLAVITGLLVLVYRLDSLPFIGTGPRYQAEFSEAAGLHPGNEVRVAGVKVGTVTEVSLAGTHVVVSFRAKGADIGDASSASIQIKTLLGEKYLAIDPAGDKPLDPDTPIPLERTVAPYDVVQAFNQLSSTVDQLDTTQLQRGLLTLSQTFKDTPAEVKASLAGLSRLSVTIASRNDQLAHLLDNTTKATGLLAERNSDLDAILSDGTELLDELHAREQAIGQLLDGTRRLSAQVHGLIENNQDQIGPSLDGLDQLTDTLQRHQNDIVAATRRLGAFATLAGNSLGNGHWIDGYIAGLLPEAPASAPNPPLTLPSR